jgi:hypothetical protein
VPVKSALDNFDMPGLFDQVFEPLVIEPVAAMEVRKERCAPQEVPEEDMELEVFCQAVFILDPRRGDERDTHYRRGYRMLRNDVRPSYRTARLPEYLVIAIVYKRFARICMLEGIFFKHMSQLILSPAFSDADPAKLVKRIDEVWQVVYCTADQGEAEGYLFSLLAGPLIVQGGLKDEGMGGHGVLSHYLRAEKMNLEKWNPSKPLFHFSLLISQIDQALEVDGIVEPGNDTYCLLYIDPVTGTNAFLKEVECQLGRLRTRRRRRDLSGGSHAKGLKKRHVPSRTQAFENIAQGWARYYQLPRRDSRYASNGADRAEYGSQVLEHLGRKLQKSLDKCYTGSYLCLCRQLYAIYPQIWKSLISEFGRPEKGKSAISKLPVLPVADDPEIVGTLSAQLLVPGDRLVERPSFTHFVELMKLEEPLKRAFYEIECIGATGWYVSSSGRSAASTASAPVCPRTKPSWPNWLRPANKSIHLIAITLAL